MQESNNLPAVDIPTVIQCFNYLYDNNSTSQTRKKADQLLIELEKNTVALLNALIAIFEENSDPKICFQALVYSCNVLKRNWSLRRYNKIHSEFQSVKKVIRTKILQYIMQMDKRYIVTLFDMLKFIVKIDYPQNYPIFTDFIITLANQLEMTELCVLIFKQIKEIFFELGERKGVISKKYYEQNIRGLINRIGELSINFKTLVQQTIEKGSLNPIIIKLSKYADQILVYTIRIVPNDIMDDEMAPQLVNFLISKLQILLTSHNSIKDKFVRSLLQKNIKSLIYDLGLLQLSKPLILSWIIKDLYDIELYVLQNHQIFTKNNCVRYALIGLKRIMKEFSYYAEDSVFMSSIKSKTISANCLQLRKICSQFYANTITENVVQQLLNFLIFNPLVRSNKSEHSLFDLEEGLSIQKGYQKQLGLQSCVVSLIEGLLQRFPAFTHHLIKQLILNSLQSNWSNIDSNSLSNLFSVLALLPSTCKKNDTSHIQDIPVLQILQYIYTSQCFKLKFASIVSGWMDAFTNDQLNSLTEVLLNFIESESGGQDDAVDVLMGSCQCLNKIILKRSGAIDMQNAIQRVVPVSLILFQKIDNPEILWPMVTLISNIIVKVQFNSQLIVNSIDSSKLSILISNDSSVLIEALCDMFKGFLCVIPRDMPAHSVYELVCRFLNNHLSKFANVNHQKIFHLWYIAIREYSPLHLCDQLYVELFYSHFLKNLYRKTSTLLYILEEYLLSGLIPNELNQFVSIIIDCYAEAEELQGEDKEKLKIAALSFQITLITKYNLEQVNSDKMLQFILRDFVNFDISVITATIHNSLLSIINRYIILYQQAFFRYLSSLNVTLTTFLEAYFKNMSFLTSHTAMKINAIAILSLISNLDRSIVLPQLHFILKQLIPEVQKYASTVQSTGQHNFIGRIENSPSLRFASNILSQRKEEIRKKDCFDSVDLFQYFREQINKFSLREGVSLLQIANAFDQGVWGERFLKLF